MTITLQLLAPLRRLGPRPPTVPALQTSGRRHLSHRGGRPAYGRAPFPARSPPGAYPIVVRRLRRNSCASTPPEAVSSLPAVYDALCGDGTLWADADQRQAAVRLEGLRWELAAYGRRLQAYAAELKKWKEATAAAQREQNGTGVLVDGQGAGAVKGRAASISNSGSLWKRALGRQPLVQPDAHEEGVDVVSAHPAAASAPLRPEPPSGLFIHGSVGTGKTMLMDLFVEAVAADFRSPNRSTRLQGGYIPGLVRRVHFQSFMIECHKRLHAHNMAAKEAVYRVDRPHGDGAGEELGNGTAEITPPSVVAAGSSLIELLVRRLVGEPERCQPEQQGSLAAALDLISQEIVAERNQAAHLPSAVPTWGEGGDDGSSPEGLSCIDRGSTDASIDTVQCEGCAIAAPISFGVLAFDEVQLMDVADATVVTGVLARLRDAGWVLVATSNRTPEQLADTIVHRQHPQARFADWLLHACSCIHLEAAAGTSIDGASIVDYRTTFAPSEEQTYFWPLNDLTTRLLHAKFQQLAGGSAVATVCAPVGAGRAMQVVATADGCARFRFEELCGTAMGSADYIALAERFHTFVITDVPQLSFRAKDKARRFITLVDALYNHKVRVYMSAAVPLEDLLQQEPGDAVEGGRLPMFDVAVLEGMEFEGEAGKTAILHPIGNTASEGVLTGAQSARVSADSRKGLLMDALYTGADEEFAFRRALSRLHEMQAARYQSLRERPNWLKIDSTPSETN